MISTCFCKSLMKLLCWPMTIRMSRTVVLTNDSTTVKDRAVLDQWQHACQGPLCLTNDSARVKDCCADQWQHTYQWLLCWPMTGYVSKTVVLTNDRICIKDCCADQWQDMYQRLLWPMTGYVSRLLCWPMTAHMQRTAVLTNDWTRDKDCRADQWQYTCVKYCCADHSQHMCQGLLFWPMRARMSRTVVQTNERASLSGAGEWWSGWKSLSKLCLTFRVQLNYKLTPAVV